MKSDPMNLPVWITNINAIPIPPYVNIDELKRQMEIWNSKPKPMTLDHAVEILNRRKHNECDEWSAGEDHEAGPVAWVSAGYQYRGMQLTEFEASVIAEWYERNPEVASGK
jgi:hypothetical protein